MRIPPPDVQIYYSPKVDFTEVGPALELENLYYWLSSLPEELKPFSGQIAHYILYGMCISPLLTAAARYRASSNARDCGNARLAQMLGLFLYEDVDGPLLDYGDHHGRLRKYMSDYEESREEEQEEEQVEEEQQEEEQQEEEQQEDEQDAVLVTETLTPGAIEYTPVEHKSVV